MRYLLILLSLSSFASTPDLNSIVEILKHVETNYNTEAIGDNGKAYGILQIHKIVIDDVNRIYGTTYIHQDAFNEVCAVEVFNLYIKAGIKRYEALRCRSPTEQDVVRFWNGGIYSGYKKKSTLKYYRKYIQYKTKLNPVDSCRSRVKNYFIK